MAYFQFVFAAITPILIAGPVLGRMSFKAWMLFAPVWITLVYTVGAFSLWGGGWLAQLGAADYSGGYVIHFAAGVSGFVGAAMIGPRFQADRKDYRPNNLILAPAGAGCSGWAGTGSTAATPIFRPRRLRRGAQHQHRTAEALLGVADARHVRHR